MFPRHPNLLEARFDDPGLLLHDPSDLPIQVEVWVGGAPAEVLASGRGPYPGIDNVSFAIPDAAPLGCYVPVQVRTARSVVSNAATIVISADGSPCSDPSRP